LEIKVLSGRVLLHGCTQVCREAVGHTKLEEFENRFLCEQMDRTDSDIAINIYKPYKNESERICVNRAHLLIRRENFQIARGSGQY
jgi:hypothetical protein